MDRWLTVLWVFLGGGTGAVVRVLLEAFLTRTVRFAAFPVGIWMVNLLGCLLIGVLYGFFIKGREGMDSWVFPLLGAGLLGGFTTFSTFSMQAIDLVREGKVLMALAYVGCSVFGGLALAALGYWAASR